MRDLNQHEISLIRESKNGNSSSFEELVSPHYKKAFNTAYRILGNLEDANDVAQDAIIKVFKSIGSFKENSSFSTWVYKIVVNTCIDFKRKNNKQEVIYLDKQIGEKNGGLVLEIPDKAGTPESLFEENEVKHIIHDAINELNFEQRKIIVLRDVKGFSYKEIAEILDCSEGTVKSRISRSRNNLRKVLVSKLNEREEG
ncbi:MAG: RNA polymerase subunit sigma-24 [Alkaliphilus sp.]|nr:RNA polymerase sigma factor [bacterium AH-315-G05]PHS32605.1 MAG: RNA polymerase subunit sigma-24 [Alkaliphilus sp.]